MICAAAFDLYPLIGAIPLQGQAVIFPDLPLAFSSESHPNLPSGHLTFCLPRIPSKPLSFLVGAHSIMPRVITEGIATVT